jgi:hypothetical protein
MLMAPDVPHLRPDGANRATPATIASMIEVMVLDVPSAAVRDIEHELATLATLPSIEMVDAARITRDLTSRSQSGAGGVRDDDLDAHEDAYIGAFFGADEADAATLRSEILEAAARLPPSRAAVIVMYRNRWRARLDGLFRSNGVQVLIERSVTAEDATGLTAGRAQALERRTGAEA